MAAFEERQRLAFDELRTEVRIMRSSSVSSSSTP
jgi:hypothetical protein